MPDQQQRKRTSQLVLWYRNFLEDGKSAAFVSRVSTRYSLGTLGRMAKSTDHELRRATILALGMVGGAESIPVVGRSLRDNDRCVRLVAEMAFSDLTRRQLGSAAAHQLDMIRRHVDGHRYERSAVMLDQLTRTYPTFAEAWYLFSIVHFCAGHYQRAIESATSAIDRNRHHFAAHAAIGRCWLELDEPLRALRSFERSFAINSSQMGVKGYIDVLRKQTRRMNQDDTV